MKRFLKVFSSFCLVFVIGFAVLLAGCAKKHVVSISVSDGGTVYKQATENVELVGDHEVEDGKNFSFVIHADTYYYISKVTVNGDDIDISSWAKDQETGYVTYHVYALKEVKEETEVAITFAPQQRQLTFEFVDTTNGNALIAGQSVTYKAPCETKFDLYPEGVPTEDADKIFYYLGQHQSSVTLRGNVTIQVRVAGTDTTTINAIKSKLQTIFTEEKGCEIIVPA